MPGMTSTVASMTYICQGSGKAAKWSTGLRVSSSPLQVSNAWVKTQATGMSAVFGDIHNPTNQAITVVGAYTSYAPWDQLHEVVTRNGVSSMQQKQGGFVIPPKATLHLSPGGYHIMLMNLVKPVKPGSLVPVTVTTSAGGQVSFTALGKNFKGAQEQYGNSATSGSGMSGMSGMSGNGQ